LEFNGAFNTMPRNTKRNASEKHVCQKLMTYNNVPNIKPRNSKWLELDVPFQHKDGYIRDERSGMESYPYLVKEGHRYPQTVNSEQAISSN